MMDETLDFSPRQEAAGLPGDSTFADLTDSIAAMPVDTEEDEQALEQYMSSMLERLTGNKQAEIEAEDAEPEEIPVQAAPEESQKPVREPARPSESKEDLSGMRALANQNAENALGVHSSRQLIRQTKSALFTAIGASVTSSALIVFTQNQQSSPSWAFPAAVAAMAAAVLISGRYLRLAKRITKIQRDLDVATQ